jgi:polyribonucleotide nucleotidyltransferase
MMDAGVPTSAPVAGIAMGLIKEGDDVAILSDILGAEDHLGDMDFKVCGTEKGITAFQMDCKIAGVSREIMGNALEQARAGRDHILGKMAEAIEGPRDDLSKYAPRITSIKIPEDKIRDIIGPGGKVIREIQSATGADINIEDDGTVDVASADAEGAEAAIEMIKNLTAEAEVGTVYHGTVTRIMNFGCFVQIVGTKEGMVHISELAPGRVNEVDDVVKVGDEIDVKVMEIDSMGRVNLSKVQADVELGRVNAEDVEKKAPRRDGGGGRGGRDGGRGRGGRDGGGRGGRR